jgi:hypothetical protein
MSFNVCRGTVDSLAMFTATTQGAAETMPASREDL